jgi:hypothetical protein
MTYTAASNNPAPFLSQHEVFPEDYKEFLVKITNLYTQISTAMNSRDISTYDLQQIANGQQFFSTSAYPGSLRSGYRQVYVIPSSSLPLAAGGLASFPHGITVTSSTLFTRIYGTAVTSVPYYIPLPYTDAALATNQVGLYLDGTNIYVQNGSTAETITSGIVVLEYVLG